MDEPIISTDIKTCPKQLAPSANELPDPLANVTPCNYWEHQTTPESSNSSESTMDPLNPPVDAIPSAETTELQEVIVFTGKKKKKKPTTVTPIASVPSDVPVSPTPTLLVTQSSLVGLTPSTKVGPLISVVTTVDVTTGVEDMDEIVFTGKRKPKKPAKPTATPIEAVEPDYSYDYLLGRLYGMMQAPPKVPNKIKLVPPILGMIGSKKTCIANFSILCNGMNREPDHVSLYLQVEFCTNGSLNSKNELTLRGKFKADQIQTGITSYISRYVKCVNCKRYNTHIIKEERLSFLECLDCQAKRTVESVRPKKRVLTSITSTTPSTAATLTN
jgi:translation initiation factor 2 subunit 2